MPNSVCNNGKNIIMKILCRSHVVEAIQLFKADVVTWLSWLHLSKCYNFMQCVTNKEKEKAKSNRILHERFSFSYLFHPFPYAWHRFHFVNEKKSTMDAKLRVLWKKSVYRFVLGQSNIFCDDNEPFGVYKKFYSERTRKRKPKIGRERNICIFQRNICLIFSILRRLASACDHRTCNFCLEYGNFMLFRFSVCKS